MARVKVKIYTVFGKRLINDEHNVDASDVSNVLEWLASHYGRHFRREVYDGDSVKNNYVLLLNGVPLDRVNLEGQRLKNGDTLLIFPPMSGG